MKPCLFKYVKKGECHADGSIYSIYSPTLTQRSQTLLLFKPFPIHVFRLKYFTTYNRDFLMSATRKQKKARQSRGSEMLSDIENLDIMLGGKSPRERQKRV